MRRVVLLVLSGLLLGALLTGIAAALPGSHGPDALTWLGSVSTVAALVVAVGIYRVQQTQSDVAHQELLDALKAQDEILHDLTDTTDTSPPTEPLAPTPAEPLAPTPSGSRAPTPTEPVAPTPSEPQAPTPAPARTDNALTDEQRAAVQARYGDRSIDAARDVGRGRGNQARLVRLVDGTLLTVFTDRRGQVRVREVDSRRERGRPSRDRRPRGPESR